MYEILDKINPPHLREKLKNYKVTPFLIIGLVISFVSLILLIWAILSTLEKGMIAVFFIAFFVLLITILLLFFERKIVTKKNLHLVIRIETYIILIPFLCLCFTIMSHYLVLHARGIE
jgi:hypothetical protein